MPLPPPFQSLEEAVANLVRDYQVLFDPGQIIELRALDVQHGRERPHVESGFFDTEHLEAMARHALRLTGVARGVYATLNPLEESLLARCANRVQYASAGALAKDRDVRRRRWLMVDVDPVRDSQISATEGERDHARRMAVAVESFLTGEGWPAPVRASTGNGYHLLYRIDLPASDDQLVQGVLESLSRRFDNEYARIDRSVFNPARICKLPGTLARKGDHIEARPHRWASLCREDFT